MKLKNLLLLLLPLLLTSCDKHLREKTFTNGDITVHWYEISTITTINHYIDISRNGDTKNIMRSEPYSIYDIIIKGDSVIIKTTPNLLLYSLAKREQGYTIALDSTVTTYDYMKKYQPENAQYYANDTLSNSPK